MRILEKDGEVYVEFSSFGDFALSVLKCVGFAIISGASFYAIWILLEFLK